MREIALFSGKIYTTGTNFARPPVVTVATNLNSGDLLRSVPYISRGDYMKLGSFHAEVIAILPEDVQPCTMI